MDQLSIRRLRGVVGLAQEAIEVGAVVVAEAHGEMARLPYAALERIAPIAGPSRAIEHVQQAITGAAYCAIRSINLLAGAAAGQLLAQMEAQARREETP